MCQFSCANRWERWTKEAEVVIREAPGVLADDPALGDIVVAVDNNDRIVGVIVFGTEESIGRPMVFSLGVVQDRRRQYIGMNLKLAVLAELASTAAGPINVVSQVHRRNHAMLAFNNKLGSAREADPEGRKHFIVSVMAEPHDDELAEVGDVTATWLHGDATRSPDGATGPK